MHVHVWECAHLSVTVCTCVSGLTTWICWCMRVSTHRYVCTLSVRGWFRAEAGRALVRLALTSNVGTIQPDSSRLSALIVQSVNGRVCHCGALKASICIWIMCWRLWVCLSM